MKRALSLALVLASCTLAQGQAVVPVVETVLTDVQKACVVAEVIASPAPPVAAAIALVCDVDAALVALEIPFALEARRQLAAKGVMVVRVP